jgi:hypothetical protein
MPRITALLMPLVNRRRIPDAAAQQHTAQQLTVGRHAVLLVQPI